MFSFDGQTAKCDYCRDATISRGELAQADDWTTFKGSLPSTRHACPSCCRTKRAEIRRDLELSRRAA